MASMLTLLRLSKDPKADDLGYVSGYECVVEQTEEGVVMSDSPNKELAGDSYITCDPDTFVYNVEMWC